LKSILNVMLPFAGYDVPILINNTSRLLTDDSARVATTLRCKVQLCPLSLASSAALLAAGERFTYNCGHVIQNQAPFRWAQLDRMLAPSERWGLLRR
jgi:hypothetical protein